MSAVKPSAAGTQYALARLDRHNEPETQISDQPTTLPPLMNNLTKKILRTSAVKILIPTLAIFALERSAKADPWTFAFFCDSRTDVGESGGRDGVNMIALHAIAADVAQEKVSLVIFPGDLVNGGPAFGSLEKQLATWKEAMAPIYDAGIPVYPCRGNHELKQDMFRKGVSVGAVSAPVVWTQDKG